MANVTNLILCTSLDEDEQVKALNQMIESKYDQRGLVSIEDESSPYIWYGGSKVLECAFFVGAFRQINIDGFVGLLQSFQWNRPESVQLLVRESDDDRCRLIDVFDLPHP